MSELSTEEFEEWLQSEIALVDDMRFTEDESPLLQTELVERKRTLLEALTVFRQLRGGKEK